MISGGSRTHGLGKKVVVSFEVTSSIIWDEIVRWSGYCGKKGGGGGFKETKKDGNTGAVEIHLLTFMLIEAIGLVSSAIIAQSMMTTTATATTATTRTIPVVLGGRTTPTLITTTLALDTGGGGAQEVVTVSTSRSPSEADTLTVIDRVSMGEDGTITTTTTTTAIHALRHRTGRVAHMLLSGPDGNRAGLLQLGPLPLDLVQPALTCQLPVAVLDVIPAREAQPVAEVGVRRAGAASSELVVDGGRHFLEAVAAAGPSGGEGTVLVGHLAGVAGVHAVAIAVSVLSAVAVG